MFVLVQRSLNYCCTRYRDFRSYTNTILTLTKQQHWRTLQTQCEREKMESFIKMVQTENVHYLPVPNNVVTSGLAWLQSKTLGSISRSTLIILCGWLGAKEHNLNKYVQLYHVRNFDVLRVSTRWVDVSSPLWTIIPNSTRVMNGLHILGSAYPNIIIHTLSAGDYFYASMIDQMKNDPDSIAMQQIRPRIKGIIFDCMADFLHTINNKESLDIILDPQLGIVPPSHQEDVKLHLRQNAPYLEINPANTAFFEKMNETIRTNPFRFPSLVLYSKGDALVEAAPIDEMVESWLISGIDVVGCCFPDAPHVALYRTNPLKYTRLIDSFLKKVCKPN